MDFIGQGWTQEMKKALIFQGLLYKVGLSWILIWWRCRDLNPGLCGYEPHALTS
jgi:hypothetical protein